ncbi:MAG: hypothetical protein IK095_04815, partial [Oscillospiraceae bacterium]|nr:hypothetical protein [Oscillospiraceae bacterium]
MTSRRYKIPLKRCPGCGLYYDISCETCACGADLRGVPGELVDEEIDIAEFGKIDKKKPVYVQVCTFRGCGTENFTPDPQKRVKVCRRCGSGRVALIAPVLYEPKEPEKEEPAKETGDKPAGVHSVLRMEHTIPVAPAAQTAAASAPQRSESEVQTDEDVQKWMAIASKIREKGERGGAGASGAPASAPAPA